MATALMLSAHAKTALSSLRYRPDAQLQVCWMPLSGICWDDEMPEQRDLIRLFDDDDRHHVLRAFAVRIRIWKREDLSGADREFWNELRAEVPGWALFRRLTVTAEQLQAQVEAEEASDFIFQALTSDADEITATEKHGIQTFSANFKVKKPASEPPSEPALGPEPPSCWQRFLGNFRA